MKLSVSAGADSVTEASWPAELYVYVTVVLEVVTVEERAGIDPALKSLQQPFVFQETGKDLQVAQRREPAMIRPLVESHAKQFCILILL